MEITRTRTGIQLRRNDIFPCGTARFGRTRHGENQRFVSDARYRTRLQRGSANLFERQHPEHFTKTFNFTVEQRQQRFGSLISFRQASTTRNQHHLYIVAERE